MNKISETCPDRNPDRLRTVPPPSLTVKLSSLSCRFFFWILLNTPPFLRAATVPPSKSEYLHHKKVNKSEPKTCLLYLAVFPFPCLPARLLKAVTPKLPFLSVLILSIIDWGCRLCRLFSILSFSLVAVFSAFFWIFWKFFTLFSASFFAFSWHDLASLGFEPSCWAPATSRYLSMSSRLLMAARSLAECNSMSRSQRLTPKLMRKVTQLRRPLADARCRAVLP